MVKRIRKERIKNVCNKEKPISAEKVAELMGAKVIGKVNTRPGFFGALEAAEFYRQRMKKVNEKEKELTFHWNEPHGNEAVYFRLKIGDHGGDEGTFLEAINISTHCHGDHQMDLWIGGLRKERLKALADFLMKAYYDLDN